MGVVGHRDVMVALVDSPPGSASYVGNSTTRLRLGRSRNVECRPVDDSGVDILRFIRLTRRRLCAVSIARATGVCAVKCSAQKVEQGILKNDEGCCWCGCGRRQMLTAIGALLATAGDGLSYAASVESSDYLKIIDEIHPKRPDWYEEFYAQSMNQGMKSYEAEVADYKAHLFQQLNQSTPKTVLELGIGTGPNLNYYAKIKDVNVIGVDPNEKMEKYARTAASDAGLPDSQFKFIHAVGERLPLPSSSVDSVISTLVLCSVKDVSLTLKEVQRVLRPGGTFFFLEHVAAREGSSLRFWQNLLDPVQQFVADGCHLTRDTLSYVQNASFASVTAQSIMVKNASLISPHVIGMAQSAGM